MLAIIYGYNEKELMKVCIQKVRDNAPEVNRIIVIDNGSDDGTYEWLCLQDNLDTVYFDEGVQPFSKMMNAVINEFDIDDDVLVLPAAYQITSNSVFRMKSVLDGNEDIAIVSAVTNDIRCMYQVMNVNNYDEMEELSEALDNIGAYSYCLGIHDGMFMIKREVLTRIDGFDERLLSKESSIDDYTLSAIMKGYKIAYCNNALFWMEKESKDAYKLEKYNDMQVMYDKWKMHYFNKRFNDNIIQMIDKDRDEKIDVLEIGCDCGATLIEIKNRFRNANVYGVEINAQATNIASHYFEAKVANIEEKSLDYKNNSFDYIIFGGVLEHLRDPESAIMYCRELLKEDGCILTSIPNLMHVSVLKDLINGNFTYTETGLLDKTHIHFFTYNEIMRMMNRCKYNVEFIGSFTLTGGADDEFTDILLSIADNVPRHMYETFQYLIRARVVKDEVKENHIDILRRNLNMIIGTPYKGVYLWKYLIEDLAPGIGKLEDCSKEITFKLGAESDDIASVSSERVQSLDAFINSVEKKDILFALAPLRRFYGERYEQTAFDSYILTIDPDLYMVLEPMSGLSDDMVYTRNRCLFDHQAVANRYGISEVDFADLTKYIYSQYIIPLQKIYETTVPEGLVYNCIVKASKILKERKAYIEFFTRLLRKVQPKLICYTHGPLPWLCYLNEAAQMLGIKTAEIAHGAIVKNLVYPDENKYADYYLTHSELEASMMKNKGFTNVVAVGKPGIYDNVITVQGRDNVVVSFISSVEPGFFEMALSIAEKVKHNGYVVMYKEHTSEALTVEERERAENAGVILIDGVTDIRNVYASTDIMIGIRSSAILDALPFDEMKIITLKDNNDDENDRLVGNMDFFKQIIDAKEIICVNDENELMREILSYEKGHKYRSNPNIYWPKESNTLFRDFVNKVINSEL